METYSEALHTLSADIPFLVKTHEGNILLERPKSRGK
jgi:hypothetical protein